MLAEWVPYREGPMPTDAELIDYAHRMMRQARPPLLNLLQRFLQLASTAGGKVKFDKTRYQREYMSKWRGRQRSKAV